MKKEVNCVSAKGFSLILGARKSPLLMKEATLEALAGSFRASNIKATTLYLPFVVLCSVSHHILTYFIFLWRFFTSSLSAFYICVVFLKNLATTLKEQSDEVEKYAQVKVQDTTTAQKVNTGMVRVKKTEESISVTTSSRNRKPSFLQRWLKSGHHFL